MDEVVATLRRIPEFARLGAADLDSLAKAFSVEDRPDAHVFVREGQHADGAFLLLSGEVLVTCRRGVEEHQLNRLGAGEMFGLVALLDAGRRSATCRAHGPVRVGWLPQEAFQFLLHAEAPAANAVQRAVASQLCTDFRKLVAEIRSEIEKHPDAG